MKAVKYLVMGALVLGMSAPVMAQDYASAINAVSQALKSDPSGTASAKQVVKDYMKSFKKDPKAMVALGEAYLAVKNYDQAVACADLAIKKAKNFGEAYVLKGDVEALKDDGGNAAMWYQQAMSIDPKNPNGYLRYANVYRKRSPQESERVMQELRAKVPEYPVDAEMGHNYYEAGNDKKALESFSNANINTISESYIAEYALAAFSTGKYDKGLEVAKKAIQRFPKNDGFIRLAMFNAVEGKNAAEGVKYAEQLINSNVEKRSNDYTYYGRALQEAGRYEEAIEKFEKAFSVDNTTYANLQKISEVYQTMGNSDKALEYSQMYLDKNPKVEAMDYDNLANIYFKKIKAAKDEADEFKKRMDEETDAKAKKAMTDEYNKLVAKANTEKAANWASAVEVYNKMVAKFPHTENYSLYNKGHQAFVLELDDEAISNYSRLLDNLKAKTELTDNEKYYLKAGSKELGYIYWASKNDLDSAKPYFQTVYDMDPNDSLAKKALGIEE